MQRSQADSTRQQAGIETVRAGWNYAGSIVGSAEEAVDGGIAPAYDDRHPAVKIRYPLLTSRG